MTFPSFVLCVVVVGDVTTTGPEEPPCSVGPICLLLFRGTSRQMSASSASSSDRGKMAWRHLLAAGRLPAALVDASSVVSSTAQWTSSVLALVWTAGLAACGQSTPGGGDTNTAARSRPLHCDTKRGQQSISCYNMTLQLKGGINYLWGRSSQLEGVLDVIQPDVIGIGQVE